VSAAIFTAGPRLDLGVGQFPLSLRGGISPTLLTQWDFPSKDFAIPFQFTSHLGLDLDVGHHLHLGYRFQHMSNARLGRTNPGLNLHVVSLSYRF
jgi:hypothetical protein